jgi:hypothetical protein
MYKVAEQKQIQPKMSHKLQPIQEGKMQHIEDLSNDEKSYFRLGLTRTDDMVQAFLRHSPCLELLLLCIKGKLKT